MSLTNTIQANILTNVTWLICKVSRTIKLPQFKKEYHHFFHKNLSDIINQYQNLVKTTSYHLKFTLVLLYYHSIKNKLIFHRTWVKIWFCSWSVKDDFIIWKERNHKSDCCLCPNFLGCRWWGLLLNLMKRWALPKLMDGTNLGLCLLSQ